MCQSMKLILLALGDRGGEGAKSFAMLNPLRPLPHTRTEKRRGLGGLGGVRGSLHCTGDHGLCVWPIFLKPFR